MTTITRQVRVIMVTGAGFLMSFMELIQDTEKVEQAGQDTEDSLPFNLLMFNFKNVLRKEIEIFVKFVFLSVCDVLFLL